MDIQQGSPTVAIPMTRPERHIGSRRSSSPSHPHSPPESDCIRMPVSIPGARFDDAPPPLPPPRYNQDLANGHDILWQLENEELGMSSGLPPIKKGSSLLGEFTKPPRQPGLSRRTELQEYKQRGGGTTTILQSSTTDSGTSGTLPSVVRRAPSPSATNAMLHGERPLAQQNLNRSNQAYDQTILSKIGKTNSPPRHLRADSADSPVIAQKLSLQTKDMKVHQQLTPNDSASTAESAGRWMTSPTSTGASPFSRQNWRDYNMGPHSPPLDSGPNAMALDPELFVLSKNSLHPLVSGSSAAAEDTPSRSARSSYDQAMYTPASESAEDGGIKNLILDEQRSNNTGMRKGIKRKSPPSERMSEDRARPDLHPKLTTRLASRSPKPSYLNTGSLSSAASSAQQASFASSSAFSACPSSLTSVSSYGNQSPKDQVKASNQLTSMLPVTSPIAAIAPRKPTERIVPQKMSGQTIPQEIRPAPARIGNHYICACCPKKPKKFETEEQLRTHENEKQYSCNFCHNRFKNKNEAERHQNSLHLRKHSWSCAALDNYNAAFSPSGAMDSTSAAMDACGYCGDEFSNLPAPDWDRRIEHLTNVHKFGECNSTKKFFRADHFRQHLKHSHAGRSGKWTNILEHACVKDELPEQPTGFSISTGESHQPPITRGTGKPISVD